MSISASFGKIGKEFEKYKSLRGEVIGRANRALSTSKRAIFALHRGDASAATALLKEADELFAGCMKHMRAFPALAYEGAYVAAREEQVEALLFEQYLKKGSFGAVRVKVSAETYLAGLSDATGEIARYALREATQGNARAVAQATQTVEEVIEFMLGLDLTGYARTKFDQAKKNLQTLERMKYEMSMRS